MYIYEPIQANTIYYIVYIYSISIKTNTVFKCTFTYIAFSCVCSFWPMKHAQMYTSYRFPLYRSHWVVFFMKHNKTRSTRLKTCHAQLFHFFHSALSQDSQNSFYEKRARSNWGHLSQIVAMVMAWRDLMNLPYIDSWKISYHPKQNIHLSYIQALMLFLQCKLYIYWMQCERHSSAAASSRKKAALEAFLSVMETLSKLFQ